MSEVDYSDRMAMPTLKAVLLGHPFLPLNTCMLVLLCLCCLTLNFPNLLEYVLS